MFISRNRYAIPGVLDLRTPPSPLLTTYVYPVRFLLAALLCLICHPAQAETVQLRKAGNATVVTFEYITLDETSIMVKLTDKDAVLSYKWEDLDLDWIKKNNPKIWAERELLMAAPSEEKKMAKKDAEVDPFAAEITAVDYKTLVKNCTIALQDGLKGMPIEKIEIVCKEFQLDETLFWAVYEDLKKASKIVGKNEVIVKAEAPMEEKEKGEKIVKPRKLATAATKTKAGDSKASARNPDNLEKETAAKKDFAEDAKPFNAIGYLRMLSEGGTKGKPIWMMLRRSTEDRKTILTALRRYETIAGDLAEKPEGKASKGEILVFKKAVSAAIESLEKVSRDTSTIEARLQSDCRSLLNQLPLR